MREVRKFRKDGGFSGSEDYIEYDIGDKRSFIVFKDGRRKDVTPNYSLSGCLDLVIKGKWVEIKQDGEKCSGCSCNSGARIDVVGGSGANFINGIFDSMAYNLCANQSPIKPEPIDFSTAQVGDTVRCLLNGDVVVERMNLDKNDPYPVEIFYPNTERVNGYDESYSLTGRLDESHRKPALIGFVDTDGKLCRTRPEPKIDWSKVAIDAPVEITKGGEMGIEILNYCGNTYEGLPVFFRHGRTSHTLTPAKQTSSFINATYKLINTEEK